MKIHPRADDRGLPVVIKKPSIASDPSTWHDPDAVATFVPGGNVPLAINGVPIRKWRDHPKTVEGWDYTDLVDDDLDEPAFVVPKGMKAASGVVIQEPDGRVWLVAPTNGFGNYRATLPKGTAETELSLQGTAIKECYEESGLKVRITGFLADVERTTSVARMYSAVRVGGSPADCGWESQACTLAPLDALPDLLNGAADQPIIEALKARLASGRA
jgi:ADP-ribose pyrophosphatase YjhB (NUDIX family)